MMGAGALGCHPALYRNLPRVVQGGESFTALAENM